MENKFWKEKYEKMQYYANRGDTHQLYKEIKKSYGPEKSTYITSTFLKKDGTITKSTTESLDRLQQYYSELLNRQPFIETSKIDQYLSQFCRPTNWTLDEEPTFKEFKDTLKAMKNHKTTAVDPIPVEIYKYVTSKKLQFEIHLIILECWNTSIMPETFHDIIICSLFKTGNKQMCENQRGISLISHLCKALSRLGANRLSNYCEKEGILPESQSAFRAHRSTNDMVFTTRLLQYSCWKKMSHYILVSLTLRKPTIQSINLLYGKFLQPLVFHQNCWLSFKPYIVETTAESNLETSFPKSLK